MSDELIAALAGAATGGIIALVGGIAQAFIQSWMSESGEITYNVAAWELSFQAGVPWSKGMTPVAPGTDLHSWEWARTHTAELVSDEPGTPSLQHSYYRFTVNFLNTKGTNAALLEYSVDFLKGRQSVMTLQPTADTDPGTLSLGQAVGLPAEDVTGIQMRGALDRNAAEKILREADRVEFNARLSTGKVIKHELDRLSQDSK